jgi:hypothetical protein
MAHCDTKMSDRVRLEAPASIASTWFDADAASNSQGLGCTSNSKIGVCTFGDRTGSRAKPFLKAYDSGGKVLWDSGTTLNSWSWTSAAAIDPHGGVLTADDKALVRFAPGGRKLWSTRTPGGAPISPTVTPNGTVVLATSDGPISAYDSSTGRRIAVLDLSATLGGRSGRFDTTNTPGMRGNRIYVSTELKLDDGAADPGRHARLYAIDVDPDQPASKRLKVAWFHEFGARSGASPLVVGDTVLFDGDRETPTAPTSPRFFGIRDMGRRGELAWRYELGGPGVASAARDPRGGAWVFAFGQPTLRRISTTTGAVAQTIDVDALVNDVGTHTPYSAMSIATGPRGRPVMFVTARASNLSAYVLAIDLAKGVALWKYKVPGEVFMGTPMGQFPIVAGPRGRRAVVFSMKGGVRALVGPAAD